MTKKEEALGHVMRAIDLLRAFAFSPDHPLHKQKILEIKGLLETSERLLGGKR